MEQMPFSGQAKRFKPVIIMKKFGILRFLFAENQIPLDCNPQKLRPSIDLLGSQYG